MDEPEPKSKLKTSYQPPATSHQPPTTSYQPEQLPVSSRCGARTGNWKLRTCGRSYGDECWWLEAGGGWLTARLRDHRDVEEVFDLMKILVMSDSHDNLWKLDAASEHITRADVIVHCGDICSPFMVRRLGQLSDGRPV